MPGAGLAGIHFPASTQLGLGGLGQLELQQLEPGQETELGDPSPSQQQENGARPGQHACSPEKGQLAGPGQLGPPLRGSWETGPGTSHLAPCRACRKPILGAGLADPPGPPGPPLRGGQESGFPTSQKRERESCCCEKLLRDACNSIFDQWRRQDPSWCQEKHLRVNIF